MRRRVATHSSSDTIRCSGISRRRPREDCHSAQDWPLLAANCQGARCWSWDGVPRLSGAFQKPQGRKPFKKPCFRVSGRGLVFSQLQLSKLWGLPFQIRTFFPHTLGIEFVSLSESLDTATPAGRLVFTVLGVVAELERSLDYRKSESGAAKRQSQRKAHRPATCSRGRSHDSLAAATAGASWATVCQETGLSKVTAQRALQYESKSSFS